MCSASTERPSAASADLPMPPIASEVINASATAKYLRHAANAPPGTFTVPLPLHGRGVGGAAVCGNPAASILQRPVALRLRLATDLPLSNDFYWVRTSAPTRLPGIRNCY